MLSLFHSYSTYLFIVLAVVFVTSSKPCCCDRGRRGLGQVAEGEGQTKYRGAEEEGTRSRELGGSHPGGGGVVQGKSHLCLSWAVPSQGWLEYSITLYYQIISLSACSRAWDFEDIFTQSFTSVLTSGDTFISHHAGSFCKYQ